MTEIGSAAVVGGCEHVNTFGNFFIIGLKLVTESRK